MIQQTLYLLRQGRKRPLPRAFGDKFRREPAALKPLQGGQQMFEQLMLEKANRNAAEAYTYKPSSHDAQMRMTETGDNMNAFGISSITDHLIDEVRMSPYDRIHGEGHSMHPEHDDAWKAQRSYNSLEWAESQANPDTHTSAETMASEGSNGLQITGEEPEHPQRIMSDAVFQQHFGFSLLQTRKNESTFPQEAIAYNELDLWGEMPRYTPDMYFLYIISRRRNTYAVMYSCSGKCVQGVMTAGNLKLKEGDRGWRAEGSSEYGHNVTSKYLDAAYPKALALEAEQGRRNKSGARPIINLVVRVMGFYNGRQGAMKAIHDRREQYHVRILEDVTPVPQNGPKMPKLRM